MLTPEEVRDRIEKGWIKSRMWFEVLAVEKKLTEDTLKAHIEKVRKNDDTILLNERFEETKRVENPMKNVAEAFSQAVETELLTKNIETLLSVVVFFGPSAVEVIEPAKLTIGLESVQVIMNSVADLIHRYAALGTGGVVISAKK